MSADTLRDDTLRCPDCDTPIPEGSIDAQFVQTKGRCFACDFERWVEKKAERIRKGEEL